MTTYPSVTLLSVQVQVPPLGMTMTSMMKYCLLFFLVAAGTADTSDSLNEASAVRSSDDVRDEMKVNFLDLFDMERPPHVDAGKGHKAVPAYMLDLYNSGWNGDRHLAKATTVRGFICIIGKGGVSAKGGHQMHFGMKNIHQTDLIVHAKLMLLWRPSNRSDDTTPRKFTVEVYSVGEDGTHKVVRSRFFDLTHRQKQEWLPFNVRQTVRKHVIANETHIVHFAVKVVIADNETNVHPHRVGLVTLTEDAVDHDVADLPLLVVYQNESAKRRRRGTRGTTARIQELIEEFHDMTELEELPADDVVIDDEDDLQRDRRSLTIGEHVAGAPGSAVPSPEETLTTTEKNEGNKVCRRKKLNFSFVEMAWGNWIVAPLVFDGGVCRGECRAPLTHATNNTNHAIMQSLLARGSKKMPKVPCAPISFKPLKILFYDSDNSLKYVFYKQSSVAVCGCR